MCGFEARFDRVRDYSEWPSARQRTSLIRTTETAEVLNRSATPAVPGAVMALRAGFALTGHLTVHLRVVLFYTKAVFDLGFWLKIRGR